MRVAGAQAWVAVAVVAAALAGALVAATLIPGSLGGTSTGSASLLPDQSASPAGAGTGARPPGSEPAAVLENITLGGRSWCHYYAYADGPTIPDQRCAPGPLNVAAVTDLQATICRARYLRRFHDVAATVTEREAGRLYVAYGAIGALRSYRVHHLVAVTDGGSATSPVNLWLEPISRAAAKRRVEAQLHERICAGEMTVAHAAAVLQGNWEDDVAQ